MKKVASTVLSAWCFFRALRRFFVLPLPLPAFFERRAATAVWSFLPFRLEREACVCADEVLLPEADVRVPEAELRLPAVREVSVDFGRE
jgi:hypothetical protein